MNKTRTALYIAISFASGLLFKGLLPSVSVQAQSRSTVHVEPFDVTRMSSEKTASTAGTKVVGFSCAFIGANNETRCYIATQ
jgi:hypothetical protein